MNQPLLNKQNFDGLMQKATSLVNQAKELNDEIQSSDETQFEKMKEIIESARASQLNLGQQLEVLMEQLEKIAKLSEQKKKIKQLKDMYAKEINRYKQIQKNLIEEGYEIKRQSLHRRSTQIQQYKPNVLQSTVTVKQSQIEQKQFEELIEISQLEIDNAVIREKQDEIDIIEKDAVLLNKIVNDMSTEVNKQGEQLIEVELNMATVQDNLKVTVKELDGAGDEQKKTLKKYIILGLIGLLVAAIIVGISIWQVKKHN
ncbi:unnamed protein product [Paramecium sonneborni]|uniref:t-SNARE coiled-coil homology domain-containing protein n=1 Tax=Paramecium sonneborni TaxID=65129 RepID=A0A8S1L2J6_9CILI|nr:unnamed protein product [Paramecium sonneborni]CAD8062148.1 unnamed protein product [Paramecium sonneborni]